MNQVTALVFAKRHLHLVTRLSLPSTAYGSGMNNILDLPRTFESGFTIPRVPTALSRNVVEYILSNLVVLDDDTFLDDNLLGLQVFGDFEDDYVF